MHLSKESDALRNNIQLLLIRHLQEKGTGIKRSRTSKPQEKIKKGKKTNLP